MTAGSGTAYPKTLNSSYGDAELGTPYIAAGDQQLETSSSISGRSDTLPDDLDPAVFTRNLASLSAKPVSYAFGAVPDVVCTDLAGGVVDPHILPVSLGLREQMMKRGNGISKSPFKETLEITYEHLITNYVSGGRMLIEQYLLAAVDSAKQEIHRNKELCYALKTRLHTPLKWPKYEGHCPHPVLAVDTKVDIVLHQRNLAFTGRLDYQITFIRDLEISDLSSGCVTLKDVQDQGQVPIMVMEAKSLEDFQDLATIQLITQAIAICRAANSSYFVLILASGKFWRFHFGREIEHEGKPTGNYETFKTNALYAAKDAEMIVGLLVTAIIEDPATMLQTLQSNVASKQFTEAL